MSELRSQARCLAQTPSSSHYAILLTMKGGKKNHCIHNHSFLNHNGSLKPQGALDAPTFLKETDKAFRWRAGDTDFPCNTGMSNPGSVPHLVSFEMAMLALRSRVLIQQHPGTYL